MGTSSFQVCMDDDSSADWLLQHQGTVTQDIRKMDAAYDSSSSSEMLMSTTCSTLMDRSRLIIPRPQHEQSPKCPRCDSTHTKFCYYNNYSLSQPRYFCKTCRRYWTKGGTLRNIPVGGGCRKNNNKKQLSSTTTNSSSSSSKNNNYIKPSLPPTYKNNNNNNNNSSSSPILNINQQNNIGVISTTNSDDHFHNHDQLMHFSSLHMTNPPMSFLLENINHETSTQQIHDQLIMDHQNNNNFNIYNSPILIGSNYNNILESDCQRTLMMPYDDHESYNEDVKPINNNSNGGKINLSLELLHHHHQQQQQQASTTTDGGYNSFVGGLGSSWTGLMNGYGSSATNPLLFN